jgi:hypothetical protein
LEVQVVEVHSRPQVAPRTQRHDARSAGGGEGVVQAQRECEVAEVVGGEVRLDALRVQREFGQRHDAGVVDEQVERSGPASGEGGHRPGVGEVESAHTNSGIAGAGSDVGGRPCSCIGVAHRECDVGARAGQGTCRFDADAGRTAGDDGSGAGQVDAGDDLVGGRLRSERGGDAVDNHTPI